MPPDRLPRRAAAWPADGRRSRAPQLPDVPRCASGAPLAGFQRPASWNGLADRACQDARRWWSASRLPVQASAESPAPTSKKAPCAGAESECPGQLRAQLGEHLAASVLPLGDGVIAEAKDRAR